jgi:DNA-binding MarR family transcriptional regulator
MESIDAEELERSWHLLRSSGELFDRIAHEEGWPVPFRPVRYLILSKLSSATAYGLSAGRIARALGMRPSSLAHHLDALSRTGLVRRAPWTVHDRRKVAIRLTETGRYAVRRLGGRPPG